MVHILIKQVYWEVFWIFLHLLSLLLYTVKSSNFVILSGENIFFRQTFLRLPTDFFRYWSLYRMGLGIDQGNFDLLNALGLKNSFFRRVTKLGYRHLISSPPKVCKVTMRTLNRGCECSNCLCDRKNYLNPYEATDSLHESIGWLRWHI